jgi:hypothetical protein
MLAAPRTDDTRGLFARSGRRQSSTNPLRNMGWAAPRNEPNDSPNRQPANDFRLRQTRGVTSFADPLASRMLVDSFPADYHWGAHISQQRHGSNNS